MHNAEHKQQLAVHGKASFNEIFAAGLKALDLEMGSMKSSVDDDPVVKKRKVWRICLLREKRDIDWMTIVLVL